MARKRRPSFVEISSSYDLEGQDVENVQCPQFPSVDSDLYHSISNSETDYKCDVSVLYLFLIFVLLYVGAHNM